MYIIYNMCVYMCTYTHTQNTGYSQKKLCNVYLGFTFYLFFQLFV